MARTLALVATLVPALAGAARADVFTVFAQADGGGMVGKGTSGAQQANAFFAKAPHGMYGAELGARFLFLQGAIEHHQYTDGSRIATWTQFTLGTSFSMDLEGDPKPAPPMNGATGATQKPAPKSTDRHGTFLEGGVGVAFGLGTGQQVSPPLDNAQITDKAVVGEARFGIGKHLGNVFDLGLQIPVQYAYFIKNGNGVVANNLDNHYHGVEGELLLYLRANIRLF